MGLASQSSIRFLLAQSMNQRCCSTLTAELRVGRRGSVLPLRHLCCSSRSPTGLWAQGLTERQRSWFGAGTAGPCIPTAASLLPHLLWHPGRHSHQTCGLPFSCSHLCWPEGCDKSPRRCESGLSLNTKTAPVQAVSQISEPVTCPIIVIFLVLFCFSETLFDLFEHTASID